MGAQIDEALRAGKVRFKNSIVYVYIVCVDFVDAGVRHFDCAPIYGNEGVVGEQIDEALRTGKVRAYTQTVYNTKGARAHTHRELI